MSQPKFKPESGQVDYTNIRWAPVVNCVVRIKDKILLVKRSEELRLYPGYWNGISGFLDDNKGLEDKVKEEMKEELSLTEDKINSIKLGEIFDQEESKYLKTWIVHPVLVDIKTDNIKLDWEAQEYTWTTFEEAKDLNLLPGFDKVLKITSNL